MTEIEKKLSELNGTKEDEYASLVTSKIRERYSLSAEFAILRQRDEKPEEFAEYNAYCEECKAIAKNLIYQNTEQGVDTTEQ